MRFFIAAFLIFYPFRMMGSGEIALKAARSNADKLSHYSLGLHNFQPLFAHKLVFESWTGFGIEPDWQSDWLKSDQSLTANYHNYSFGAGAIFLYVPKSREYSSFYYGTVGIPLWD